MNLETIHTQDKPLQTKSLFTSGDAKVTAVKILAQQQLKEHNSAIPALLLCVIGKATFEDEKGQTTTLLPGDFVPIEPNVKHWINAKQDSHLLLMK
jgi:quercetin dioxygenase-like cupin family protein